MLQCSKRSFWFAAMVRQKFYLIWSFEQGLKKQKTQVLLKKPAGRLIAGFFTGFSGKTGFLKQAFSLKISIFGGQYQ
jgi:hypothetical protein